MNKSGSKVVVISIFLSLALVFIVNYVTSSIDYIKTNPDIVNEENLKSDYIFVDHYIHYSAGLPFKSEIRDGKVSINISPICNPFTCPVESRYPSSKKDINTLLELSKTPQFFLNWLVFFILVYLPAYLIIKKKNNHENIRD